MADVALGSPVQAWHSRRRGRQVSQSRRDAAGYRAAGQNRLWDLPVDPASRLAAGRTLVSLAGEDSAEGPLCRYHREREREVCPGGRLQQVAAWLPRNVYRRRSEDDHHPYAAGMVARWKGGQELRSWAWLRRKRLLGHFAVHFSIRTLLPAEAFVLPGKANGCGLPRTADAAPRRILPTAAPAGVIRRPAFPAWLIPSMRTLVCLVVEPAPLLAVGFLPPWLFPPSAWGKSCVPADQTAVFPHPFLADRGAPRLAWPLAGADRSTRFALREVSPRVEEPHPILERRTQPALPDGWRAARGASAVAETPLLPLPCPCHPDQNAAELPPWPLPCPCHLDRSAAELPLWPRPFPCHPDRSAAERRDLPFLLVLPHLVLAKPPARQIRASHFPGNNTFGHPWKANESAAWRPGRAPLPAPANATRPGREKSQSLRWTRRKPTAGTWIPATKAQSPARCRQPWSTRPDAVCGAAPTAPDGQRPRTPE